MARARSILLQMLLIGSAIRSVANAESTPAFAPTTPPNKRVIPDEMLDFLPKQLLATITVVDPSATENIVAGPVEAKLVLRNNTQGELRIGTRCQAWGVVSEGAFRVELAPDRWKGDPPSADEIKNSLKSLKPGESVELPFQIPQQKSSSVTVDASYQIGEHFAREYRTWTGYVRAKQIVFGSSGKVESSPTLLNPNAGAKPNLEVKPDSGRSGNVSR